MMKSLLILAGLALSTTAAQAEIFTCTFTEPFVTVTYTTGTQVMTVANPESTQTLNKIGFLVAGSNRFELSDEAGKVLMEITYTGKGSDGMSDLIYPFEAKSYSMINNANAGLGGCTSLNLKASGSN